MDEFFAWLDKVEGRGVPLFNPAGTIRWNARKTYLRDLESAGVSTVPTEWLERGSRRSLADVTSVRGWDDVVVKPTVSAAAFQTWRAGPIVTTDDERCEELHGQTSVSPSIR